MPPQQQFTIAAPGTEEMTKTVVGVAGAGITGVVEGVIVKMAPQLGALETPFTWAALLGIPLVGVAGALFTKGMIGDLMQGVAAGGTAIAAYTLPAMLMPDFFARRAGNGGSTGAGADIKQLGQGLKGAAQRAQQAGARVGIEF
ncbi:hypothetical protein ES703_54144 [subsurface metagenome]